MENEPLLFIDTLKVGKNVSSNQIVYDTRISRDKVMLDKINTIVNMRKKGHNLFCEILIKGIYYKGNIVKIKGKKVSIEIEEVINEYNLSDIEKISILKM